MNNPFIEYLEQAIWQLGNHEHDAKTVAEFLAADMEANGWVPCRWDEELQQHTPAQAWEDRL